MPTYTHQCKNCFTNFEDTRPMEKNDHKPRCPACKSRNTRKLQGKISVIYRDSDFTQYKGKEDS